MVNLCDRALNRFAVWFASAGGVWQTLLAVMAIVLFEYFYPDVDPSGILLMFWLTIYSGITQPALAYVNDQAGLRTNAALNEELQLLREELLIIKSIAHKLGEG